MKSGIFIASILFLVGCASQGQTVPAVTDKDAVIEPVIEQNAAGEASIMTNPALKSYREEYVHATEHKAFAQSESGAWSWKSNRTSIGYAIDNALIGCQRNNRRYEEEYPCKIINIDGVWTKEHSGASD